MSTMPIINMDVERRKQGAASVQTTCDADRKKICLVTGDDTYAWDVAMIPSIVRGLREQAQGGPAPEAGGMVFFAAGLLHLSGESKMAVAKDTFHIDCFSIEPHEVRKIADALEEIHKTITADGDLAQEARLAQAQTLIDEVTRDKAERRQAKAKRKPAGKRK
jgi:hypothetical protein